jgi:hypothetical protein
MMNLTLLDAIPLDTDLVSDYPALVKLGDHLFEEIATHAKITNKYRGKEALKLILINLYKGYRRGRAVRYSRDKNFYSSGSRYHQIWFKYDRIIPIIDALKALDFVGFKEGIHYRHDNVSYQSRIWAGKKLIDLFYEYDFETIGYVRATPPRELIQLRESNKDGGREIDYKDTNKTDTMRSNLRRYIKFIENQNIEVRLPHDTEVSWHFLDSRRGNILSQRIDIIKLHTNNDHTIEINGERYHGFQWRDLNFIIHNGEITQNLAKLISELNYSIVDYNTYYKLYIQEQLFKLHKPISKLITSKTISITSTTTNPIPKSYITTIPMTQGFSLKTMSTRALTLPRSTTIGSYRKYAEKRPLASYGIHHLEFRCNYQRLHRVFTRDFDRGGRFYGAVHLDLPEEVRARIFINGEPSVELDYGAHHVRMLYNWQGIAYDKDPYDELCEKPEDRPIYKKVLLVGINAETEMKAIKAVSQELRKDGFKGIYLKHRYLKDCLDRFKDLHKPIAGFLHTGEGLSLQYDDSRIVDLILMKMVRRKIPVLPVHDSIIAPAQHEQTLHEVMTEAYQKIMGKKFISLIK